MPISTDFWSADNAPDDTCTTASALVRSSTSIKPFLSIWVRMAAMA